MFDILKMKEYGFEDDLESIKGLKGIIEGIGESEIKSKYGNINKYPYYNITLNMYITFPGGERGRYITIVDNDYTHEFNDSLHMNDINLIFGK